MNFSGNTEEEIINFVGKLSNEELSEALKAHSCKAGPVTRTTRMLYEKRLRGVLIQNLLARSNSSDVEKNANEKAGESLTEKPREVEESEGVNNKENKPANVGRDPSEESSRVKDNPSSKKQYFAVQVPAAHKMTGPSVFEKQSDVWEFCKLLSGSRFKVFNDLEHAKQFSQRRDFSGSAFNKIRDDESTELSSQVSKESLRFSSIKWQDFVTFKKAIEVGNVEKIKKLVWSNPRYLIGNGDNPTILQEGCRYNALHVSCRANQLNSCRLIVETITNPEFYYLLYEDDMPDERNLRLHFVVDLYLNNREKGNLDTPLHLACKFGHEEVVKYLLSVPFIDKNLTNNSNKTPLQVVCTRLEGHCKELKDKIMNAFEDQYYIFILRSEDNTEAPLISRSFCPFLEKKGEALVPIGRTFDQSPRSYKHLFDSPSNQVTSLDLANLKMQTRVSSSSSMGCSPSLTSFTSHQSMKSRCDDASQISTPTDEIFSRRPTSNQKSDNIETSDQSESSEKSTHKFSFFSISENPWEERSLRRERPSRGHLNESNINSSRGETYEISRVHFDLVGNKAPHESPSECYKSLDERSNVAHVNGLLLNKNLAEGSIKTASFTVNVEDNGTSKLECKVGRPPSNHLSSYNLTPAKSTLGSEFKTPKSINGMKIPVVCKTPKNKHLILLTDPESQILVEPFTPPNRGRPLSSTPCSVRKSSQSVHVTPKQSTQSTYWEKLVNLSVFSATDSPRRIRAVAGPMPRNKSEQFRHDVLLNRATSKEQSMFAHIKRTDSSKGLERVCRNVAKKMSVSWCEYWDFLERDVDLTSGQGLDLLEDHLKDTIDFSISICEPNNEVEEKAEKECRLNTSEDQLCAYFCKLNIKSPPTNNNKKRTERKDVECDGKDEDTKDSEDIFDTPDDDKFTDAQDKLDDVEEFFELNSRRNLGMFIHGDVPTRADADAYRALEAVSGSLRAYPYIYNWFTLVASHPESERVRWRDVSSINHALSTPRSQICPIRQYRFSSLSDSPNVVKNLSKYFDEEGRDGL